MAIPTRSGPEFQINADPAQSTPDARVIALDSGRFLVVWGSRLQGDGTEGSEVRGQIYGANGSPVGASFTLTSSAQGAQILPDIALLANGQFAATWAEVGGLSADLSSWATRASILSATGVVQSMFDVNTTTTEGQYDGRITPLNDGGFVIAWQDHSAAVTDPTTTVDIRVQIFNADGSKRGSEFVANTSTSSAQMTPAITTLSNGNFVVSWWDQGTRSDDASSTSVRAQIYTPSGVKVGGEFLINTVTNGAQAFPALTPLANGGFFAAYGDQSGTLGDPSGAVNGQFFSATGAPVGAAFRMNLSETEGTQTLPDCAELPDGRIVAVWVDYTSTGGGFDRDIRAQVFNANGTPSGEEFLVNSSSVGIQEAPTVAVLTDGRFVVTWTDDSVANDNVANVHAQIFDPRTGPTGPVNLVGTDAADTLQGGAFNDTLNGGKGNDLLQGEAGNDNLAGANGNDTIYGGDGSDTVSGGNDHDRLYGGAGNDVVSGGKGNDVLWSGLGRDTMSGGVGADDFVFLSAAEAGTGSARDTISDFAVGVDDIDLSAFMSGGDFIGAAAFSGTAGEVRYVVSSGILSGDVNGDGVADWQLMMTNRAALTDADFIF